MNRRMRYIYIIRALNEFICMHFYFSTQFNWNREEKKRWETGAKGNNSSISIGSNKNSLHSFPLGEERTVNFIFLRIFYSWNWIVHFVHCHNFHGYVPFTVVFRIKNLSRYFGGKYFAKENPPDIHGRTNGPTYKIVCTL